MLFQDVKIIIESQKMERQNRRVNLFFAQFIVELFTLIGGDIIHTVSVLVLQKQSSDCDGMEKG